MNIARKLQWLGIALPAGATVPKGAIHIKQRGGFTNHIVEGDLPVSYIDLPAEAVDTVDVPEVEMPPNPENGFQLETVRGLHTRSRHNAGDVFALNGRAFIVVHHSFWAAGGEAEFLAIPFASLSINRAADLHAARLFCQLLLRLRRLVRDGEKKDIKKSFEQELRERFPNDPKAREKARAEARNKRRAEVIADEKASQAAAQKRREDAQKAREAAERAEAEKIAPLPRKPYSKAPVPNV